jgi:hypothetical protein
MVVTRWKKYGEKQRSTRNYLIKLIYKSTLIRYWLYGEIQERDQIQMNPTERRALRGWFPRTSCSPSYVEYEKEE